MRKSTKEDCIAGGLAVLLAGCLAVVIDWVLSGGLGLTGFLALMAFTAGAITLRVVVGLLAAVFK